MEEVNRFAFHCEEYGFFKFVHEIQVIVKYNEETETYHLFKRTLFVDGTTSGEFIEDTLTSPMDNDDYISWLSQSLRTQVGPTISDESKRWAYYDIL